MDLGIEGKVAIVTGGSRGLGREFVLALAREGVKVVISSRKQEACDALADEVRAMGGDALPLGCHVGDWAACDRLVEQVYDHYGQADILINNAGMSPLYPSLGEVSEALFDKVVGVNLRGPFRLSSLVGERMVAADGGSIINVSSIAAVMPTAHEIPYATAKAGLNNLTIGMARALAPKVRVNCIMPGPFLTDIADAWTPEMKQGLARIVPLGRGGAPDECVGAMLYFASDQSAFTTGAVLKIDGGAAFSPA